MTTGHDIDDDDEDEDGGGGGVFAHGRAGRPALPAVDISSIWSACATL